MDLPFPIEIVIAHDGAPRAYLVIRATPAEQELPERCIVGELEHAADSPAWPTFTPNPAFLAKLEAYLRGEASVLPAALEEAAVAPDEHFYLIDGRVADPDGKVEPSDIVAAYETDDAGRPRPATMRRNPNHQLVSPNGTFSSLLSDERLHSCLAEGS